jgi:hypothetical protein
MLLDFSASASTMLSAGRMIVRYHHYNNILDYKASMDLFYQAGRAAQTANIAVCCESRGD